MNVPKLYRHFCFFLACCIGMSCLVLGQRRVAAVSVSMEPGPDIVLDPGHGGVDGGAVGKNGTVEKDINLAFAFELKKQLEAEGLRVLMTRTEDRSIHDESANTIRQQKTSDLKNRLALANTYPDALFISLHQNSLPDSSVHGTVFYYGTVNPESRQLADYLHEEILKMQPNNRKVIKQAQKNLFLLTNAAAPAVLVECGFLSNPEEEGRLCDPDYRQELCSRIRDGVLAYLTRGFTDSRLL